jgi:hypothetical protein
LGIPHESAFAPLGITVEIHADATAHADDHGLAVHRLHASLEMRDQILGNHVQPFLGANKCLDSGPFALQPFLLADGLILGQFFDLGVNLGIFESGNSIRARRLS